MWIATVALGAACSDITVAGSPSGEDGTATLATDVIAEVAGTELGDDGNVSGFEHTAAATTIGEADSWAGEDGSPSADADGPFADVGEIADIPTDVEDFADGDPVTDAEYVPDSALLPDSEVVPAQDVEVEPDATLCVGTAPLACFADADLDGFAPAGALATVVCTESCPTATTALPPADTSSIDCDDASVVRYPGAAERCNGLDDDCSTGGGEEPAEDGGGDHHSAPGATCAVGADGPFPLDDGDDTNSAVWASIVVATDSDGDGRCPNAPPVTLCTDGTIPLGYMAPDCDFDCDDSNAGAWAGLVGFPDGDGDLHCASDIPQTLCTSGVLPAGYSSYCLPGGGGDCNDGGANTWVAGPYYRDGDGDGHSTSETQTICTNGAAPPGWRANCSDFSDCNDSDSGAWTITFSHRDADSDGHCTAESQYFCGGPPSGWRVNCTDTSDCNDGDGGAWSMQLCGRDADHDGWCSKPPEVICAGNGCPAEWIPGGNCVLTDRKDNNPYATVSCGLSIVSESYGHCCGIFCGQPNPWYVDFGGSCGVGFHPDSCVAKRVNGGGTYGVNDFGAAGDSFSCRLALGCIGLEGVTAFASVCCVAD